MTSAPELAGLARVLASDARATMTLAMLDGRAWTLTELAKIARVSTSTASEHVDQLVASRLVEQVRQGRHRYLRIRDVHTAETIEAFAAITERVRPATHSLRAQNADRALREARSCYRHLAGHLGVTLCDGLRREGMVSPAWELTGRGTQWLDQLGVAIPRIGRRALVRPCLDWTERREHLAGAAADALCTHLFEHDLLRRVKGSRAVQLTPAGHAALGSVLAIT